MRESCNGASLGGIDHGREELLTLTHFHDCCQLRWNHNLVERHPSNRVFLVFVAFYRHTDIPVSYNFRCELFASSTVPEAQYVALPSHNLESNQQLGGGGESRHNHRDSDSVRTEQECFPGARVSPPSRRRWGHGQGGRLLIY